MSRRSGVAEATTHRPANTLVEWGVLERAGRGQGAVEERVRPSAGRLDRPDQRRRGKLFRRWACPTAGPAW
ncbi:helix-turn-helix domain-containing protein [Nocardia arthritidis]|uniref:helix-turn-helix domain-containing protein n=1 Tax=Nocardia arthritidis TaxID=228602 RepID=UPI001FDED81E|nr:helix-turn-helix domain-containing protein [Nocardia arthritidis]